MRGSLGVVERVYKLFQDVLAINHHLYTVTNMLMIKNDAKRMSIDLSKTVIVKAN